MPLETDLQQKSFRSDYQKALLNIIYTSNFLLNTMNDFFKEFDITRQQYNVLRILRGQKTGGATIQIIRNRMLDKMSDASRIVERLRVKGLINRENNESDKRSVLVTINEPGLKLLEAIEPHVDKLEQSLKNLSPEEASQLNYLLDKIRASEEALS